MNGSEIAAQGTHWNDNRSSVAGLSFPTKRVGGRSKTIMKPAKSTDSQEKVGGHNHSLGSNLIQVTMDHGDPGHRLKIVSEDKSPF